MLSRKCKYGLKAALRLATEPAGEPMNVTRLASAERIPKKFLDQILLELKRRGILQSRKGQGGGYMLGRPPGTISFGEIVRTLEGPLAPIGCVSVTAYARCVECEDEARCGVRMVMKRVRDATADILDHTMLADVVAGARPPARPRRRRSAARSR
jgi:Rrf2 family protein